MDSTPHPEPAAATKAPRWVKVFGLVAVVLALLVAVMLLTGGGHGPGRHTGSDGGTPSSSEGHLSSEGGHG